MYTDYNLKKGGKDILRASNVDDEISKIIREIFGVNLEVTFHQQDFDVEIALDSMQKQMEERKASSTNVERFVMISNKYTDLQTLTPEILRTFIDKVIIHERTEKWAKTAEQQIDIYFRYVGCIVPESSD